MAEELVTVEDLASSRSSGSKTWTATRTPNTSCFSRSLWLVHGLPCEPGAGSHVRSDEVAPWTFGLLVSDLDSQSTTRPADEEPRDLV